MKDATQLFNQYLRRTYGFVVHESRLIWEAVTFYQDELDEQVVPVAELARLGDPLTVCCATHEDDQGVQWLFGLAIETPTGQFLHAWIVRNGEIVDRDVPLATN